MSARSSEYSSRSTTQETDIGNRYPRPTADKTDKIWEDRRLAVTFIGLVGHGKKKKKS